MVSYGSVCIRVEGNRRIGTGHVRRCIAIASALKEQGVRSTFVLSSSSCARVVEAAGFELLIIDAEIGNDIDELLSVLEICAAKFLIVDSYYADERYFSALRATAPVFTFIEGERFMGEVDVACDYSFAASQDWFDRWYASIGATCLVGPDYAPLQPRFWDYSPCINGQHVGDVLVTSGGTDPQGICAKVTHKLLGASTLGDCTIHVAVGPLFGTAEDLRLLADSEERIVLHEGEEMADLLEGCDIVVSSGGTTVYEVMRMGVPGVFYSFVDNQVLGQFALESYGHIGDIRDGRGTVNDEKLDMIVQRVSELYCDKDLRSRLSLLYLSRVDGQGARRIAATIKAYLVERKHQ